MSIKTIAIWIVGLVVMGVLAVMITDGQSIEITLFDIDAFTISDDAATMILVAVIIGIVTISVIASIVVYKKRKFRCQINPMTKWVKRTCLPRFVGAKPSV